MNKLFKQKEDGDSPGGLCPSAVAVLPKSARTSLDVKSSLAVIRTLQETRERFGRGEMELNAIKLRNYVSINYRFGTRITKGTVGT